MTNTPVTQDEFDAYRLMSWFRVIVIIIVSVVFGVVLSAYEQRDQELAGCERNSFSKTLSAAGFDILANRVGARGNQGDQMSAAQYQAISDSIIDTIPAPGKEKPVPLSVGDYTVLTMDAGRPPIIRPTTDARRKQREGCEDAYPLPIPFVE